MTEPHLVIYTDGGARGNPGPAASGVVIMTPSGTVLEQFGRYLGATTNNQAEYKAVLFALEAASAYQPDRIDFKMDSELAVRQLNGIYKVKNPDLKLIYDRIKELAAQYNVSYNHVYRAANKLADAQVNLAIDAALGSR